MQLQNVEDLMLLWIIKERIQWKTTKGKMQRTRKTTM